MNFKKNAYEQSQIPVKADVQKHNLGKMMNSECQKLFLTCRFCHPSELLTTSLFFFELANLFEPWQKVFILESLKHNS